MKSIKLTIPLTPGSLNKWQRAHWAKRRRIQDDWDMETVVALAKIGEGARLLKLFERAKIRIRYFFRTKHPRDKDNYTPKVIMDCLKGRVIVDDSSDRIDLDWELLYDRKASRTEILVEEIE
ncbi:unnamed protein product [marine sediment metagenome]|uniref:Uncharacterized protein n=1 Tax=marine sediment metagenome TaxID=412755 RepID=X1K206_9ZZZZ